MSEPEHTGARTAAVDPVWAALEARSRFLATLEDTGTVREEIAASWRRSVSHGVAPDRLSVPYQADREADDRLIRAVRPVAGMISGDLEGTAVTLGLADSSARIVGRWLPHPSMGSALDRLSLAPGFSYGEESVGTNSLSLALHHGRLARVSGGEHFAESLAGVKCVAAPITDPATGQVLGVIGLTCPADYAAPLMTAVTNRARWEVQQRLLDEAAAADRALLAHFFRARRRAKGPLVLVNDRVMHANTSAAALVHFADRALLWDWVSRASATDERSAASLRLTSGQSVSVRAWPVEEGGVPAGALLRIDPEQPPAAAGSSAAQPRRQRPAYGWGSLTGAERSVATVIAEGATNREAAARLFLSRHTIDFHLRQIFRKLQVNSRVELTRLVVEHAADQACGSTL
ncbi:MAG TPA: LuxR C-terminal-related transcriptional regulator [Streptosporangiaceae bacterium]